MNEILLHENQKVSAEREEHEKVESYFDAIKLYHIDNMKLEDT